MGSPRKNKSCNFLIVQAIIGIKSVDVGIEIKKVYIPDYNLTPCNGCDQYLRSNDYPLLENDDTRKLEEIVLGSSALIIAAQNYFG